MNQDLFQQNPAELSIFSKNDFTGWTSLNDTIMGGSSDAICYIDQYGLNLKGNLIEEGGGFVSCRSPILKEPLDLSYYKGIRIELDGDGRTLKLAISCKERTLSLRNLINNNVRWIAALPTKLNGTTFLDIPFDLLEPTIRAKPVLMPVKFYPTSIIQFQILHSKFGLPGKLNPGFRAGSIHLLLRSISAFS